MAYKLQQRGRYEWSRRAKKSDRATVGLLPFPPPPSSPPLLPLVIKWMMKIQIALADNQALAIFWQVSAEKVWPIERCCDRSGRRSVTDSWIEHAPRSRDAFCSARVYPIFRAFTVTLIFQHNCYKLCVMPPSRMSMLFACLLKRDERCEVFFLDATERPESQWVEILPVRHNLRTS